MIHDNVRLEIIHVRLSAGISEDLLEDIRSSVTEREEGSELRIYSRAGLPGDIGIHILFHESAVDESMSSLGMRLASELREFGMVEHSLWTEVGSTR
ncbi:MAG: hypothetical protein KAJ98_13510 [Spirochaetaceae bacterium]|nr:hypothetical protein [Spirochaetaceae bacterium]